MFYPFDFISSLHIFLFPVDVSSLWPYVPAGILPFDFLSHSAFVLSTFCPLTFFTVTVLLLQRYVGLSNECMHAKHTCIYFSPTVPLPSSFPSRQQLPLANSATILPPPPLPPFPHLVMLFDKSDPNAWVGQGDVNIRPGKWGKEEALRRGVYCYQQWKGRWETVGRKRICGKKRMGTVRLEKASRKGWWEMVERKEKVGKVWRVWESVKE